jgi:pimeloyl-ACP methyl ester carboxylesterase
MQSKLNVLAGVCVSLALMSSAAMAQRPAGAPAGAQTVAAVHPEWLTLQQLRAKYADPAGRIARIKGVEVYYKDEGAGPVLLMIHGSNSTLRTWDVEVERLKSRYRIIRFDIPPQGLSGPVSDAAVARLRPVDIPEGLLDQLHVTRATVIGVSSGGTLAVALAAKRPELVERLILSDAPSDPVVVTGLKRPQALLDQEAVLKATGFKTRAFWDAFFDFFGGDPRRITPELRQQYYDMNRRGPEPNLLSLDAKVSDDHAGAVETMAKVRAPTLLLWGGKDPLLPPSAAHALMGYLTGAQVSLIILPDVGHYPPLEAPVRFAEGIEAYIELTTPR